MAAKKDEAEEKKEGEDKKDDKSPAEGGAEGAPAEGAEGAVAPKSKKKLIIIIAAAVVVLLGGGGAAAYFMGLFGGKAEHVECAEDDEHCKEEQAKLAAEGGEEGEHGEGEAGAKHAEGAFLPIPTMIVNLASDDGTPRYLRLTVQLELKSQEDLHAVEAVIPRVIDQFQTYLRELRVKDLRGSAGIYRLQMELLWRVNQAAAPVEVKDVLFQEILIQ